METKRITLGGTPVTVHFCRVLVAGSGAAGFNAADTLLREGVSGVAMITCGVRDGTSRNTGSDKQTYYKLSLSGEDGDSVRALGETLFAGGAMDGDIALCEAASSAYCFSKLVLLGVPFPRNRYGEFIGYKTDHDPSRRATSAGPYTSKFMAEALEKSALSQGLKIFDHMQIVKILVRQEKVLGLLCLDLNNAENPEKRWAVFWSPSVVWAVGGPGEIYARTVYPENQYGASGAAFEAGAMGRNLTEWQFGLASLRPRWNVSGTFMQVLPRFVSSDESGGGEREFLQDYLKDPGDLLSRVFLKGYQWPFDGRKLSGSSLIDVLVFLEQRKGRRVYLDFRANPGNRADIDYGSLSKECRDYLEAAGACFGAPIDRLERMNKPAVEFYRDRGVDLHGEMLEIALCAQHNNGGLGVDRWWRSNIEGLFPVGEAAGTHGVYRPGGSALNAGQAGSLRAALFIAGQKKDKPDRREFLEDVLREALLWVEGLAQRIVSPGEETLTGLMEESRGRMTLSGGAFRNGEAVSGALAAVKALLDEFAERVRVSAARDLAAAFRFRDILISQFVYLSAMEDYISRGGKSRGSALYYRKDGEKPHPGVPEEFRTLIDNGESGAFIQEIRYGDGRCAAVWRPVRPIPEKDDFFENVWRSYRETGNMD
ncbi:MAG: FAD-binding protein [Treponema sp.]|jgi:succinate dehydrogenase/fumarate reductase flavoprotein subunit|nr:FAD-binding protein [Treponema sp.]